MNGKVRLGVGHSMLIPVVFCIADGYTLDTLIIHDNNS